MTRPQITAIIPCYNATATLKRAVESIERQTVPVHQIVIVDDGSRDGSWELIQSLGTRVLGIRQENSGPATARNRAFEAATGDWIAYLDADDEWLPDRIERQLKVVQDHGVRWCACNVVLVYRDRQEPAPLLPDARAALAERPVIDYLDATGWNVSVQPSSMLVRRDLLEHVGGWDKTLVGTDDIDLWQRLAIAEPAFGYVQEPCVNYYVDIPTAMTNWANQSAYRLKAIRKALNLWPADTPRGARARQQLRALAFRSLLRMTVTEDSSESFTDGDLGLTMLESFTLNAVRRMPRMVRRRLQGPIRDLHRSYFRARYAPLRNTQGGRTPSHAY